LDFRTESVDCAAPLLLLFLFVTVVSAPLDAILLGCC
jgi:hypothetical protein